MRTDTSKIREFLRKHFDDEELEALCFDYFAVVHEDFSRGMTKGEKIQLLLDYCRRQQQMPSLMAALERERATLYQQEFASVPVTPTAPPTNFQRNLRRNPRQIFISHATADAELAHRLAADLQAEGWAVWLAPDSILPGEKWVEAINRGLAESGVFLLLLTPEAVASRWVTTETNVAIGLEHQGLLQFIPLEIKSCEPPPLWLAYQYVGWRQGYDKGWQNLQVYLSPTAAKPSPRLEVKPRQPEPKSAPPVNIRLHEKSGLEFIRIPAGEFFYGDEKKTIVLKEYWIGKTQETQAQ
jgi:hypothetical protein